MNKCRDCGGRLLGIEVPSGRCGICERALEVEVRGKVALQPESSVTGSVTKQQKYRRNNPEKTKADTAVRVARWRRQR